MTEFEWEQTLKRDEAAALLRKIADGLAKGGEVTLEQDSWELKLNVPDKLEVEIEVEVGDGETELEIELKWASKGGGGKPAETKAAGGKAAGGKAAGGKAAGGKAAAKKSS